MASESPGEKRRSIDLVIADIEDAIGVAVELVSRGKDRWNRDRLLRLAGEAIIGRVADSANRLPEDIETAIPKVQWDDIRDIRILVDHIYHRIDYDALWKTLKDDLPQLMDELNHWRRSPG